MTQSTPNMNNALSEVSVDWNRLYNPWGYNTPYGNLSFGLSEVNNASNKGLGFNIKDILGDRVFDLKNGTITTTGLGGTQGLADLSGALSSLYSIYNGFQTNKRANQAWQMQKQEYNRDVQKQKDFANNIAKSGLGIYSAGV